MRGVVAGLVLSTALLAVMGCDDLPGKPTHAERYVLPVAVKDFAELYGTNCAGCHGADGRLGPARALNDPLYQALVSDDELRTAFVRGVGGTSMPAFATSEGGLPGSMLLTFLVCFAAVALLWVTLVKFELTAKSASGQVKRLRRALDAPGPSGSSRIAPEVS